MRAIARALLSSSLICGLGLAACSGDDTSTDTGGGGGGATDAGRPDTGPIFPDATVDAGPRPDSGVVDSGTGPRRYCLDNGNASIERTAVPVAAASAPASLGSGEDAVLSCIDQPFPTGVDGQITFVSCMRVVGTSSVPSQAALDALEIAVFLESDPRTGQPNDPTFDPTTGADRQPAARIEPDVVIDRNSPNCAGGVQVEIGRNAIGTNAVRSTLPYVIRMRTLTSSTAPGPRQWATVYNTHIIVPPDAVTGGQIGNCTAQACSGVVNLVAVEAASLSSIVQASGANPAGASDLNDQVGDGYAMLRVADCGGVPLVGATGGFSPAPGALGYLTRGAWSNAMATDADGLVVGVGFTGTSSLAPAQVTGAAGVIREAGACTETYGGARFSVYPDAITVLPVGRTTVVND